MNKRPPRRNFRSNKSRDGVSQTVLRLPRVQEQTHAETLYLAQLIQDKTPVIVKLSTTTRFLAGLSTTTRASSA